MTPETWKLIASIGGVLITVVTGPMIWAIRAEAAKIRTEMQLLRAEMKLELAQIKAEMAAMEARLNQRIDTRLVHR